MVISCCIKDCTARWIQGSKGWARIPKLEARRRLWLIAINRTDFVPCDGHRVCPKHFVQGNCQYAIK